MKKVLFLCSSYRSGGAERGFVSLLNALPLDKMEAHVMVIEEEGLFKEQLPENIIVKHAPKNLVVAGARVKSSYFWKYVSIPSMLKKVTSIVKGKFVIKKEKISSEQYFWREFKNIIPENEEEYDAVISFMAGICNYYAIDKVKAKKKFLWVHSDYNKMLSSAKYDEPYFTVADKVATISSICVDALTQNFPLQKEKFILVENVSPASLIIKKSKEKVGDIQPGKYDYIISSVGRLHEVKGYDMAVEAARIMKDRGLNFCWNIIGEGEQRPALEKKIKEYGLEDNFKLLGLRANPYPYVANSTIFVMTSRYEGKSIALDEAKILCKPIMSTIYPSVYDNIQNGVDGVLAEQNPVDIANAIESLCKNKELRQEITSYLTAHPASNETKVREQIMNLIEQ